MVISRIETVDYGGDADNVYGSRSGPGALRGGPKTCTTGSGRPDWISRWTRASLSEMPSLKRKANSPEYKEELFVTQISCLIAWFRR